jgi:hypothetical protein
MNGPVRNGRAFFNYKVNDSPADGVVCYDYPVFIADDQVFA